MLRLLAIAAAGLTLLGFCGVGLAGDWPLARGDAARSGYSADRLPDNLSPRWCVQERHPPQPAWARSNRMPFDRACDLVAAGDTLYYGSSADERLVARDAATGQLRWSFVADAPIRFAPAVWQDRVLFASDDGFLYCLAAADGRLLWKVAGSPRQDWVLGNDRLVSRWPARGGPVIVAGTVYFGAGIWPSEGIFLKAVDIATGQTRWCNDSAGGLEMNQPHPGARAQSGLTAQGNLAVAGDTLLVPTGRGVPAALNLADGGFRYFHLQAAHSLGGSEVVAMDGHYFNTGVMYAAKSGEVESKLLGGGVAVQVATHPRWLIYAAGKQVGAIAREKCLIETDAPDRKGKPTKVKSLGLPAWTVGLPMDGVTALIVAGDTVVVGGKDQLVFIDAANAKVRGATPCRGTVYGLAVAASRLFVSTDQGQICCFDGGQGTRSVDDSDSTPPAPETNSAYVAAAEEIVRRAVTGPNGSQAGYCVDLACGDGRLAWELAQRTKLRIYAVDSDPAQVQAARRRLQSAGLYGARVTVHLADPASVPYPNYFADLIVSGRSVTEGPAVVPRAALARLQRPFGGIACVGRPNALQLTSRGPLEGAAEWTHQYADAANTLCSGDTRLKGPLGMLWYRDTDIVMPSRHGRGPAPLVAAGRMFVEGLDSLRAVNIYNGTTLWEVPLPGILKANHQDHLTGVAATGSNLCLGPERLFVHRGSQCVTLDARTGQQLAAWDTPPRPDGQPGTWGFLAYRDGTVFGSVANTQHLVKESWRSYLGKLDMTRLFSESLSLFALDATTGVRRWTYTPQDSLRHNAIALGAGRVYLIDRPPAVGDTPQVATSAKPELPPGRLICLDSTTGKELWQVREDVFGTVLALSEKHDVLVLAFQPTAFRLDSEVGERLAAYRASDGKRLWSIAAKYKSRPVLNDRALYAEPGKWDLLTGQPLPFEFARSYGCGILAGAAQLLTFRSATLGYYDLEGAGRTENYGGIRPGCWVNAIPAGGLVLMADAASWCTCSYLNQATIALQPLAPTSR